MRIKKFHRKMSYSMNSAYSLCRVWINLNSIFIFPANAKEQPDTSKIVSGFN